jgi:uncharacterized protein
MDPSKEGFGLDSLLEVIRPMYEGADPAHDFSHILRVFNNAHYIGVKEGADMQVLLYAAILHDMGSEPKSKPVLSQAETQRQRLVESFLIKIGLPEDSRQKILYAVKVHRFSKGITPTTLEAKILQDADRLDAMGAIGIARVFLTGGSLGRALYDPEDPFCASREPDGRKWNIDHFYTKLLRLESGMHTKTAKMLAGKRSAVLKRYLSDLKDELEGW